MRLLRGSSAEAVVQPILPLPKICTREADAAAISEWFTIGRFGLLLGVFIFCMFPDVVLGTSTFVFRDFSAFGYPLAHYHRECFWRGEIPLWNPLNNLGIPFLAQWNTMVLYPLSLFYLLFPLPWSLPTFCLGHMWLAGIGMYLLAWRWTGHRLGAVVAGLGFAFNGFTLNCLMWPNYMAGLGWMPLVVYAVDEGWRRGGRWVIYAAVFGAMQMLSGVPEVILFTWFIAGMLWLFCGGHDVGWLVSGRRWLGITLLVTGLSAAQLLPFLDLLAHSHRGVGFSGEGFEWAIPLWGWANFLVPLFRSWRIECGIYFQPGQNLTSSYYLGIGMLALALAAARCLKEPRVRLLWGIAVLAFVLALGKAGYLLAWLQALIPQFGFVRYPVKYLLLVIFAVPLLAAFGLCWAVQPQPAESSPEAKARLSPTLPQRSLFCIGTVLFLVIAGIIWFSRQFPIQFERWPVTMWSGVSRAGFLLVILAAVIGLQVRRNSAWELPLAAVIVIAVWLDIYTHTPSQNPKVDPAVYARLPRGADLSSQAQFGHCRAMLSRDAIFNFANVEAGLSTESSIGRRLGLDLNRNLLDGIPKADGFYALYIPEERRLHQFSYGLDGKPRPALADLLGVGFVTSRTNLTQWEPRSGYMPLVTAGQKPVFGDPETSFAAITNGGFAPRNIVYLPLSAKGVVKAQQCEARIENRKITDHEIQLTVQAEKPAIVIIAQSWYHWWKARVDSQVTPLWKANYGFQAVEVPAGTHEVRISYEDQGFRWGVAISLASILIGIIAWLWIGRGCFRSPVTE